jgi:hypothetical protein
MTANSIVIASTRGPGPAGTKQSRSTRASLVLLSLGLAACAAQRSPLPAAPASTPTAVPPSPYVCLLPSERRMLVAELFFGRNRLGRRPVSDTQWAAFARDVVTPNFPAGFTVFDGAGQWRDGQTGHIERERTKILLVAAPRSPDLALRLTAVIDTYKARFHQQSVGVITRDACAGFN